MERPLEILGQACFRLAKLEPSLIESVANLKPAIDLRNQNIHGYDSVDNESVYLIVMDDLDGLKADLNKLLAMRG